MPPPVLVVTDMTPVELNAKLELAPLPRVYVNVSPPTGSLSPKAVKDPTISPAFRLPLLLDAVPKPVASEK